ncbi:MAG: leucyl/phenylalanyl-tRNA--protein transferase [Bacteroidales bacterium]|jgi:leucyl/phenylalanyl-tRNA--protein transferase|nr:leucyl/phenylalanyl-tRNA--protein transferase [Bacteroidales bacterium]
MQISYDLDFPPVNLSNEAGLLAVGGTVSPGNLLRAYSMGIFPWYSEADPIMWWSPDPRMVLRPEDYRASKSLKKLVREGNYKLGIDTCFKEVMNNCAQNPRKGDSGTWITADLTEGFVNLHEAGFAHSFEIFMNNELVGGLYGLAIGKVFFGESMFFKVSNASKLAFYHLIEFLLRNKFKLIDAQQETAHLKSLGAYSIMRRDFIDLLNNYVKQPGLYGNWGTKQSKLVQLNL